MSGLVVAAYQHSRYAGTVCHVRPATVDVNLPKAAEVSSGHHAGFPVAAGQVGEFVVIEGEEHAVLGRIIDVRLPERDRLAVEPTAQREGEPHPIGVVQLLAGIDLATGDTIKGISPFPRVGQRVYSAHPKLIKQAIEDGKAANPRNLRLGCLSNMPGVDVAMSPEHILGRHCAILGATGGGKSWTLATMVEEITRLGGKAILFDATGEYHGQTGAVAHVHLGGAPAHAGDTRKFVSFPYFHLTETDLFTLFRPSAAAQSPKLREALRSLKLVQLQPSLGTHGLINKAGRDRTAFDAALVQHAAAVAAPGAPFSIGLLAQQIELECIYPTSNVPGRWGNALASDVGYCATLMARIEADISAAHMACLFKPEQYPETLTTTVNAFMGNPAARLLRVTLEDLPFEHNARELVANAVGRYLLGMARSGSFRKNPLVVLVDEAHQFLDKAIGDELSRTSLDAFALIAKEGRKYGLTCVLATQRPRDIPEDVLSQMGMFIVHRLINERDRAVVEKACGQLDATAAAFLPTLSQGEAVLVGVDAPMPLPIRVRPPRSPPDSRGPDYGSHWLP